MTSPGDVLVFPPDWEDEDRMHFLLAFFPPTAVVSMDNQKVQFWSSLVRSVCRVTRRPVFTAREVAERLQWRGQTPSCLQQVLVVMRKSGQLCAIQDLVEDGKRQGWLSWGASTLSVPVRWMWRKYGPQNTTDTVYVDTQLLQDAADTVLCKLQSTVEFRHTDQVVSEEKLNSVILEVVEGSAVEALELVLVRQGKLESRERNDQKVVKFSMTGDRLPVAISDMDLHIFSLKETIAVLQTHTSSLAKRVARMKKEARNHLQEKQREMALSCLRQGRGAQHKLAGKAAMLANLEDILYQIQTAETNTLVLEAYRKGTEVLKTINDGMLTAAEDAVDELHEVVQESEEVGEVLGGSEESEELEKELEALLCESAEGSTRPDELAEQLSKLELLSPPTTHPVQAQRPAATPLH